MTDTTTFLPRLSHCPYCRDQPEGEQYIDIADYGEFEPGKCVSETATIEKPSYDITRCIRFVPCGHAFEEDSINEITDALRELRRLRRERRACEDAGRLRRYDYEIEAQVHAVNNRMDNAAHREELDAVKIEEEMK